MQGDVTRTCGLVEGDLVQHVARHAADHLAHKLRCIGLQRMAEMTRSARIPWTGLQRLDRVAAARQQENPQVALAGKLQLRPATSGSRRPSSKQHTNAVCFTFSSASVWRQTDRS